MRRIAALLIMAELGLTAAAPPQLAPLRATTVASQVLEIDPARREVVIVQFWATWCLPCRVEMPLIDAAWRKYGKSGVRVVGIALDAGASRQKIAAAGAAANFPLARLADTTVKPRDVPAALPDTLVYGRDGRLRYHFQAGGTMLNAATLDRIIPPLLAER